MRPTTIQFKRACAARWRELNIVLQAGEPGFITDENRLKIGDGVTAWNDLPYVDDGCVVSKSTHEEFPSIGRVNTIYKAEKEKLLYQWNATEFKYEVLGASSEELQDSITTLQQMVGDINEVLFPSAEGSKTLLSRVETLETETASIDQRIDERINAFAEQITDDDTINTLKELIGYVAEHGAETVGILADIEKLHGLVGEAPVSEQIDDASEFLLKEISKTERKLIAITEHKKFEIVNKPVGALVDYRESEIRVMCPVNTEWTQQNVGSNGNPNMYYMTFRAYAPDNAVSFKEGDRGVIIDEMFTFNSSAAGIDEFGRKYSVCWLALASYDATSNTWTYFGKNSSINRYIGWDYVVEWYDENGVMIGSDAIRINLSNESCHNTIEPFYMSKVIKGVKVNGTLLDVVNGEVEIDMPIIKSSDEENKISVAEDGTMAVNSLNVNKLVQNENEYLVLYSGSSAI